MSRRWTIMTVALALVLGAIWASDVAAQKTKGKTRAASTKQLMKGIVQPNCAGCGGALKTGPADDAAWETLATQAAVLNELSYVLMDDGRCPDAVWAGAAKQLREGTTAVIEAVGKKDVEAARAAFKTATGSCAACHKAHKTQS